MTRIQTPFVHPDISSLAKFLRSNLHFDRNETPKQTELLNVLAKSCGYKNHAAYKASTSTAASHSSLVSLEIVSNTLSEYYVRDSAGELIDRRHRNEVEQLQFSMNVVIDLGDVQAELVVHAIGRGRGWSFNAEYDPDERGVGKDTLKELGRNLAKGNVDLFSVHEVEIGLARRSMMGNSTNRPGKEIIHVSEEQFAKLVAAAASANAETARCERVIDWMRDYSKDYLEPSSPNQALLAFVDYLDSIIVVSGQAFMYSWNREKAAGIRDILRRWAKGKRRAEADRDYVYRNLFVFDAPKAWLGRPPVIPDVVQRAMV